MGYNVGQVLYLCNEKKMKIIPIQIVEELKRTSLEETSITYIAIFPDAKRTKFDISKIEENLFTTIESVKVHMLTNVQNAIDVLVSNAMELEKNAFDVTDQKEKIDDHNEPGVQAETSNDIIMVDLGNGTKAKINTSSLEKVVSQ